MSKLVAYEKKREREKEEEKKVVGPQQKTQPSANKPVGTTPIPAKNNDTSGRAKNAKEQARQDRARKTVERNPSARNYENDTRTRRTELRTTKQRNEDERKEKRLNLPGYSAGQYGKNSNWTPTTKKIERGEVKRSTRQGKGYDPTGETRSHYQNEDKAYTNAFRTDNAFQNPFQKEKTAVNPFMPETPQGQDTLKGLETLAKNNQALYGGSGQTIGGGTIQRLPGVDDLPFAGVNQLEGIGSYDLTSPDTKWRKEIDSDITDSTNRRSQLRDEGRQGSAGDSFWEGVFTGASALPAAALNKVASLQDIGKNIIPYNATPEEAYNRVMGANGVENAMNTIFPGLSRQDLENYKNYVSGKIEEGTATQDDIDRYNEMRDTVMKYDPVGRSLNNYADELALNEGLAQSHPVANLAGKMVPMTLENIAGSEAAGAVLEGLPQLTGLAKTAAGDAIKLMPDFMSDIIPNAQQNIANGDTAGEVLKKGAIDTALNYGFNKGFDFLGAAGSKLLKKGAGEAAQAAADTINASNMAKQAADVAPDPEQVLARELTNGNIPGADTLPNAGTIGDILQNQGARETAQNIADNVAPKETTEQLWDDLVNGNQFNRQAAGELNEQGQKLSKLHQTLQNTDKLTDAEKTAFADKNGFWYDPDNEKILAQQAQNDVAQDIEGVYRHYAEETLNPGSLGGADAHRMFTASYDYTKLAQEATQNGDKAAAELYTQKARNLMLNAREAATKGGQFNAAIKYYARTPQGIVNKAYDLLGKQIADFNASNPKLARGITDASRELARRLDGIDVDGIMTGADEAAKEDLRAQVINGLADIAQKTKNRQLKETLKDLSAADVDKIIMSRYEKDIAKQLDMFSMGAFGVKPETIDKVLDIFAEAESYGINSKDYFKLEQDAYSLLANDLMQGKSFRDKVDAWRYFSMLGNPTTHIRNNLGNLTNNIMTGMKNNIAAGIEAAADRVAKATGGEGLSRTKSLLNPLTDDGLIKASALDFDNNAYRQYKQAGNKYINVERGIEGAAKVWKDKGLGKVLNRVTEFNNNALDVEDVIAGKAKYQTSLAGFLKANGADASIFNATDEASKELLEQGREFALKQANEATFHQSNAFAEVWSRLVKDLRDSDQLGKRIAGDALNITIPFTKTPSNILKSCFAYSPAEFVKVLAETPKLLKGTISGADYIDDIAKGVTGSFGMIIGGILAHEGILTVTSGDSDLDEFNEKRGRQSLALKIGNNYVDIGSITPASMPIILGATVYNTLEQRNNGNKEGAIDTLIKGATIITDTVADTTMVSGLADTLSTVRYTKDDAEIGAQLGLTVAGNFASQMLPTFGSKLEKILDDTKRSSYTDQKGLFSKFVDRQGRYLKTKVPGSQALGEKLEGSDNETLSAAGDWMTNEPQIDPWGNEVKQQDFGLGAGGRALNNLLNPLDVTTDQNDPVDNELRNIYENTLDTSVLNYGMTASSDANVDGAKMTDKQWTKYQKGYGALKHELAETMMNLPGYENMEAYDKIKALESMKSFAKAYWLNQAAGKPLKGADISTADMYEKYGPEMVVDGFMGSAQLKNAGISSNSNVAKDIKQDFADGNAELAQEKIHAANELTQYGLKESQAVNGYYNALKSNPDLTAEEYAKTYTDIDGSGDQKIQQTELLDYLNNNRIPEVEGKKIWDMYKNDTWTRVPNFNDGAWGMGKTSTTSTNNSSASASNINKKEALRQKKASQGGALPDEGTLPEADKEVDTLTTYGNGQTYDYKTSKWFQKGSAAGYSDKELMDMHNGANYDGQGRVTKDEAKKYIDSNYPNASASEKRKLFEIICTSRANNPY